MELGRGTNYPKRLEQQPKDEAYYKRAPAQKRVDSAVGSGEPMVGAVGVAELPQESGKHRF